MNLAHAIVLGKLGRSFGYALASFLLIANLAIFFVWTFPTNQATNDWSVVPKNWNALRIQWEYSYAANAVATFAALVCVVISVLRPAVASEIKVLVGRPFTPWRRLPDSWRLALQALLE